MLISGKIIQVKPPSVTDRYGNQYQWITVQTHQGPIEGLLGTKQPFMPTAVGDLVQFEYSQKDGKKGKYNSFKKMNPQYTDQNASQVPQQASQSPNDKKDVDWDAKDERNARMNALNNATAMLCLCAQVSNNIATYLGTDMVEKTANEFFRYIYNGLSENPQEDIPF